jgi:hypothetical protein
MNAHNVAVQAEQARAVPRTRLFLAATIRFDGNVEPIRIRDLSASGARIEGSTLPEIGAAADITRGTMLASGRVMWREAKACGFRFDEPLPLEDWIPTRITPEQVLVNRLVERATTGDAEALPGLAAPRPQERLADALPKRLAEELAYVTRLIESFGDDLSGEPLILTRYSEKLQNLDLSTKILRQVAALLVADDPEHAIDAIPMDSLRKRLRRTQI